MTPLFNVNNGVNGHNVYWVKRSKTNVCMSQLTFLEEDEVVLSHR